MTVHHDPDRDPDPDHDPDRDPDPDHDPDRDPDPDLDLDRDKANFCFLVLKRTSYFRIPKDSIEDS